MDVKVDSNALEKNGLEIIELISTYKETIDELYSMINNMPNKTFEWVGQGSINYVNKFNQEHKYFIDINDLFVKYGQFLIDYSNEIERISKRYD